jgi:hypothetical protein
MLLELQNNYITGRHNVYPNNRVSAFALLNNWNGTYDRGFNVQLAVIMGHCFCRTQQRLEESPFRDVEEWAHFCHNVKTRQALKIQGKASKKGQYIHEVHQKGEHLQRTK